MTDDVLAELSATLPTDSAPDDLATAKERIGMVLGALGIEAVISVDDAHFIGGTGSAQEVTEAMAGVPALLTAAAVTRPGVSGERFTGVSRLFRPVRCERSRAARPQGV